MNLFQTGDFTLASGENSGWKIECDSLGEADWEALAKITVKMIGRPFGVAYGVPKGGIPFADELEKFSSGAGSDPILLVDDVLTTGASMTEYRDFLFELEWMQINAPVLGIVAFARRRPPDWITPIFQLTDI